MRAMIFAVLSILAVSANAEVILDCSTPVGPDQSISVERQGAKLILKEEGTDEKEVTREIPQAEWDSRKIRLQDKDGFTTILQIGRNDGAYLTTTDGSFTDAGPADCDR